MSIQLRQAIVLGLCLCASSWAMAAVREYHLYIDEQPVKLTGKTVKKISVNGQFTAPLLEFEEGDEAVIHVHNQLQNRDSSIHWHGLLLPGVMDGVPGFNGFQGIAPKGHFTYRFQLRQQGTYWYHAHSKGQEQDGLYGPLVIYPKGKQPVAAHEQAERDYVVMLSDFHASSSDTILNNLKKSAEYYQNQRETLADVLQQVKQQGLKQTWQQRSMWNQMRMLRTDLSDVTGYQFLINGKTPEQAWTGLFRPNEKVRLRFINASAMSFFDVRIPQLKMTVISADGQPVQPVPVDEFRIGTAETYDVLVEPKAGHYQIEAESIDRSGFAIGSLLQQGMQPPPLHMPTARPRAVLTMEDMGHAAHGAESTAPHAVHSASSTSSTLQHPSMTHAAIKETESLTVAEDHPAVHSSHATQAQSKSSASSVPQGWANASTPAGHKALRYADLKALKPQPDTRAPVQELVIRLGGTMERYIWTINGKKFSEAEPLQVAYGERIRLKFINDSMMAHPMHLHGMFMQLENGQAAADLPNKHTLIVPPGKTVSALLTADELGEWAIHCHLLYHMSSGMMNKLVVAQVTPEQTPSLPAASSALPAAVQSSGDAHAHH